MLFKITYAYIAQTGKLAGSVRAGTVACDAKDVMEAKKKAEELISSYGHKNGKITSVVQW